MQENQTSGNTEITLAVEPAKATSCEETLPKKRSGRTRKRTADLLPAEQTVS